jgi:allantoin racemase
MKICVVHVNSEELSLDYTGLISRNFERVKRPDTEIVHKYVARLRRAADTVLAFPIILNKLDVVQRMVEAEAEGCDAVMVACSGDPGVTEARTLVDIPVVGPMEAALHLAAQYGKKIGIVTVQDPSWIEYCETMTETAGLVGRLGGIEKIDISSPVAFTEGFANPAPVRESIVAAANRLVERGCNTIVLGSAGLSVIASNTGLAEVPGTGIPIFDTMSVGFKMAELRADLSRSVGLPVISRVGVFEKMDAKNRARIVRLFKLGWTADAAPPVRAAVEVG